MGHEQGQQQGQQQRSAQGADDPGNATAPSPEMQTAWKQDAARAAVEAVPSGITLGLGSGTTAELMLRALAERVRAGLRVLGVPTSERTRKLAGELGIPLAGLDDVATLDMSIDGADEVLLPSLDLIKGHGGALLHEKLIAAASRERVIIVDASKVVRALGSRGPVPIEVTPFGWRHTAERVAALGCRPMLRLSPRIRIRIRIRAGRAPTLRHRRRQLHPRLRLRTGPPARAARHGDQADRRGG